jgi:hypothetical protein
MDTFFQGEWFGRYWLKLFLTDRFYLALLIGVIIIALLIMRIRKR